MKVTIDISDFQVLKVLAMYPATEEQAEAVMAAVRETPELDITEQCRNNKDYSVLALSVCAYALAVIVKKHQNDTPNENK